MEDIFEELAAVGSDDEGRADENDQGGNRDDEAEEANDTKRVVKPKRITSRPRPKLDSARLLGHRGIFTIKSTFDNIKFKGKGHELDDLNNVLSRLQHWAHRLFPKMTFEDCIDRIENLGNKREIMTNMHKIRNGMIDLDSGLASLDNGADNDRVVTPPPNDDAFNQLVGVDVAPAAPQTTLTDEQRARMMRNRLLAEERRMARRLAREKELQGQRQAANLAADESNITPATVPEEGTLNPKPNQDIPIPPISIASDSAEANLTLTAFDGHPHVATAALSESFDEPTSLSFAPYGRLEQPRNGSNSPAAGEEDTRDVCGTLSSSDIDDMSKLQHSGSTTLNSITISPLADEKADSSSKPHSGHHQNIHAPALPEPHLNSNCGLMEIDTLPEAGNVGGLCPAEDRTHQSSSAMGSLKACQSEISKSATPANNSMDVGSAADWEAAFGEDRVVADQQSQP